MLQRIKNQGSATTLACRLLSVSSLAASGFALQTGADSLAMAIDRALGETHYEAIWQVGTAIDGVDAAWQAPNRAADLRTFFLPQGVTLVPRSAGASEWSLSMSLRGLSRGLDHEVVSAAEVTAEGRRVELRHAGIVEWYRNDERGLEQGFDIARRPLQGAQAELELQLELEGELALGAVEAGRVTFVDEHGQHTLTMDGLFAQDAQGARVPCRFERRGEELAIVVDDASAVYPITIDPLLTNEVAKLDGEGSVPGSDFGTSIDQTSSRAVVGAPGSSAAYVFQLSNGSWELEAKLGHVSVEPGDQFGCDVALSGTHVAIGARLDDTLANDAGAVYSYELNQSGSWVFDEKLTAPGGQAGDHYGSAVDLLASWLIVGAPEDDTDANNAGAVHAYYQTVGNYWEWIERSNPNGLMAGARYGSSLDFDGLRFAAGSPGFVAGGQVIGAVHVLEFDGGFSQVWRPTQTIVPFGATDFGSSVDMTSGYLVGGSPHADFGGTDRGMAVAFDDVNGTFVGIGMMTGETNGERFGSSVAISGNSVQGLRVLAGAPGRDTAAGTDAGAAYVMEHQGGTLWTVEQRIEPSVASGANFGSCVHLVGTTAFVAAPEDTGETNVRSGSLRVYARNGSLWSETQELRSRDRDASDQLGHAVAISGDRAIVGVRSDDDVALSAGAAFLFRREGGSWQVVGKLTAGNNASAYDDFGCAVDIDGTTAVVGARFDESANGTQCGAAFVFGENLGGAWALRSRLVPQTPVSLAYFGQSLAVKDDVVVVGAWNDFGSASNSGAAYVYRNVGVWVFEQKLSLGQNGSSFGYSVDVDGGRIAIGSPSADANGSDSGEVRVLEHVGGSWQIADYLAVSQDGAGVEFGKAVALSGSRLVVGAPGELGGLGRAYVFKANPSTYSLIGTLSASDGTSGSLYGSAVAIDGDVVVVGAERGDSGGSNAGEAYVYQQSGFSWLETDILLASDGQPGDYLGRSVAVDGLRILAGAPNHDSDGVNNSGAAYIFEVDEVSPFQPFNLGDGSGSACPCGNESQAGSGQGCANSSGAGARLFGLGSTSLNANDMVLAAEHLPANQNALLFMGTNQQAGAPFGDGLLGMTGFLVRLPLKQASPSGEASWTNLHALGIWSVGDTAFFQVWYRDPFQGGGPCGSAFNLSNGLQVSFEQ